MGSVTLWLGCIRAHPMPPKGGVSFFNEINFAKRFGFFNLISFLWPRQKIFQDVLWVPWYMITNVWHYTKTHLIHLILFWLCMAFTLMVTKHNWRVALHCQVEWNSSSKSFIKKCLVFEISLLKSIKCWSIWRWLVGHADVKATWKSLI